MEPRWLMLGFFTTITAPAWVTELCLRNPPAVRYASFKALEYKQGTLLNCDCQTGFRRANGLSYVTCLGNSSWSSRCQCASLSNSNTGKQVTPSPAEDKERKTTPMQISAQPVDQEKQSDHCGEPPPWEHEGSKRIYHFTVGQTVHYQCMPGYKALQRGPATSTCKTVSEETVWTQPPLKCIDEGEHHEFPVPGGEESQGSPDRPVESKTPRSVTTTDSQQFTEAAATMKTFVLTAEHQLAVAGCVFLLISILLLSGLTWQWRWKKSRRSI